LKEEFKFILEMVKIVKFVDFLGRESMKPLLSVVVQNPVQI